MLTLEEAELFKRAVARQSSHPDRSIYLLGYHDFNNILRTFIDPKDYTSNYQEKILRGEKC